MDDLRRMRAEGVGEAVEKKEGSNPGPAPSNTEKSDNEALSSRYIAYLRSIKDNWSSCHAARLLTPALLVYIYQRFLMLSTPLKVRVLTSFLYLRPALREGSKDVLTGILKEAETDPNEWVKKLSRILMPYISSGRVDLRETDTETAFRIISFLDEQHALHPEEGNYRRKGGLEQQHICDPDADFVTAEAAATAAASANFSSSAQQQLLAQLAVQQPATLEMNLFSARENFDDLMTGIVKRGTQQLRRAAEAQQQREEAALHRRPTSTPQHLSFSMLSGGARR
ncbi:apicomplexan specific protein [Cystoisospora suis]|uniref:Apicomplexan specific protein n=1 Tax=Cystoisospora suis TaxID=483139 RepID=A0A2C6LBI2_9APIC|nr:apicomplexan specific protein [Cystoisospora suis]